MRNRLDTKVEMNNNHNKRKNESKKKNRVIEELRKHKRVIIMFALLCVIIYIFCIVAKLIKIQQILFGRAGTNLSRRNCQWLYN